MRRIMNGRVLAILSATTAALVVGVIAHAQNLDVKGTSTIESNGYFYGNVGIGTTTPGYPLDVNGTAHAMGFLFGNQSLLGADQGGSIELGAQNGVVGVGLPYIDFHFNGLAQDFNVRLINDANGQLTLAGGILNVPTAGSNIAQPGWSGVSFQNGWVNYANGYNPAGFMKDSMGFVHLRGLLKGGTMGQCAFTLPAGYAPPYEQLLTSFTSSASVARVDVTASGCVLPVNGSNAWLSIDGLTYNTLP